MSSELQQSRIEELRNQIYDLDQFYIAHRIEYSDSYWNSWYKEQRYDELVSELKRLKEVAYAEKIQAILCIMRSEPLYNPHGDSALVEANKVLKYYADRIEAAVKREREERHNYEQAECARFARAKTAAMRHALERILDIEGYGAPMLEAKCIAQKALEGQQCTPPPPQVRPKIEQPGSAAAMREALEDVLFMAEKYAAKALATSSVILFYRKTGKVEREINYLQAIEKARAALSAPPRNCDRFATEAEARKAFYNCYFGPMEEEFVNAAFIDWLFSTAEGGAK